MLKVNDLTKSFQGRMVLKGVNFEMKAGETVVIMGPSGCGKSTTIKAINGLIRPDKGRVEFLGESLLDLPEKKLCEVRKKIGFVFQTFNLIQRLSVLENLLLPLIKAGLSQQEAHVRAIEALKRVDLFSLRLASPRSLSGGEKQRVGIARALVLDPPLILLDEPTASLDPILVQEVLEVMEELSRDRNRSLLLVTHEISFARKVAGRILFMDQGRVVEEGPTEKILTKPQSWISQRYCQLLTYG